jgi:hypothetical protein
MSCLPAEDAGWRLKTQEVRQANGVVPGMPLPFGVRNLALGVGPETPPRAEAWLAAVHSSPANRVAK